MKKIMVTGGCGYIGSHTIVTLLENGYEVISIDSLERGDPKVPEHVNKITGKSCKNYKLNLNNIKTVRAVFREHPDIAGIIHFAAYKLVNESVQRPLRYYTNNLFSLINILLCLREFKIPNLIFSSSSSVYGNIGKLPVKEDSPVCEQESPYGRTKYFGEMMIADLMPIANFKGLILRYFNPAGAHESGLIGEPIVENPTGIVSALTSTAAGRQVEFVVNGNQYPTRDGSCIRDYIHVMDVAEAHVVALEHFMNTIEEPSYLDIINLGTGNGISVIEMVKSFESANKIKLPVRVGPARPGDAVAVYSDNTKAKKILGWEPKRSLDEMMRSAWKWEQAHPKVEVKSVKDGENNTQGVE